MTNATLIKKLKKLKTVKPRRDWVLLTKNQILGEERKAELFPFFKPAYAGVFLVLLLLGIFEFSQDALPGESLYYLKKITERSQIMLSPEDEKPVLNLELANKRLEELERIASKNEVKKLAPAMDEFHANISEAAKNLAKVKKVDKELVVQTKKLEEKKEKVEKVLATKIETKEIDNAMARLVKQVISEMEQSSLTEKEKTALEKAKMYYEQGEYAEALIEIYNAQ